MVKRIRIRRTNDTAEKVSARQYSPRWEQFDIVRLRETLVGGDTIPNILTVVGVIPDKDATDREGEPGAAHEYRLRSLLSGNEMTLTQWQLEDVDAKYARFAVAFYKGVLVKLVSTVREHIEDAAENDEQHGWDDSPFELDDVEEAEEERPVRRRGARLDPYEEDEDDEPEPYRSDRRIRN